MPIVAVPDHVAVAVPDIDAAAERWQSRLHGVWLAPRFTGGGFGTRQLRYGNLAKLELLEPDAADGFAAGFLARFGPRIHHVTLKVPDLLEAVETLAGDGFEAVDVAVDRDDWHEAFLRPSQVGGLIVQVAWTDHDDERWATVGGGSLAPPHPQAPSLLGPTLAHPDLGAAAAVWTALGAEVASDGDGLLVGWDGAPLTVRIERGTTAGPVGLRFDPDPHLPADPVAGAATLPPS